MLDRHARKLFGICAEEVVLKGIVPVDITEAARMFFEDTRDEMWAWDKDFPTMVSPWPIAWFEWRTPKHIQSDGVMRPFGYRGKFAALVLCSRWNAEEAAPSVHPGIGFIRKIFFQAHGHYPSIDGSIDYAAVTEPVHWILMATVFADTPGRKLVNMGYVFDYLNGDGVPIVSNRRILPIDQAIGIHTGGALLPVAFAISLIHCKNTALVDRVVPEKIQKARRRRGKDPKVVYKTLEISPMKQILRTEGRSAEVGLQKALHICRGHFKDYREKGLFGSESHKGIYWWDMHIRGVPEAGVVIKDYKLLKGRGDHND